MTRPIITLTTDFGLRDHYAATMKGVILSRCPEAQLVDITHDIPPFSLYDAAYAIDQAAPFFPPGAIHVVVVDPGVGTDRKPLLVECKGQFFVAPDNGVLSLALTRHSSSAAREITNRELWLPHPSSTFHGRDIFAPVAAALASGIARPKDVGPLLENIQRLPGLQPVEPERGLWRGRVLSVDRFGNVITNFTPPAGSFSLTVGQHVITELRQSFGAAAPDLVFAYVGSSGYLEVAINQGNAAQTVKAAAGDIISLRLRDTIE
ncbi:MAG TPA: SAM-dependent chlorinase/fluorinase [Bryobacteraceae bacterium]|nr:SAM-dependent chlorinase/fluorinase [Bryobacteraceae bacterium]